MRFFLIKIELFQLNLNLQLKFYNCMTPKRIYISKPLNVLHITSRKRNIKELNVETHDSNSGKHLFYNSW